MDRSPKPPTSDSLALIAAEVFVDKVLADRQQPLVMFALDDCLRCEQARMFLIELNTPFRSLDLNAAPYEKRGFGNRVRSVIHLRTGCARLPKIFLSGTLLGGCAELREASGDGRLGSVIQNEKLTTDLQR